MRKTFNGSPGLWTAPHSELAPGGALKQASNCIIRVPGLIEQSRPQRQYCIGSQSTVLGLQPFQYYGGRFICAGGNIVETGTGTKLFSATTAPFTIARPDSTDQYFRHAEVSGNFYFPTTNGYLKFDTAGGNPYIAGIPRCLDVQLTLVASGSLLANTNSVGYRVLFGFKDANTNLILGPPSGRATVTATAAQDVTVKAWIHTSILSAANATSYFVQVYRTSVNTTASSDPGEEMQLVYQAYLTSTDVSNKYISFTDVTPDALRGAQGYFCPSQDGLDQANYQPPVAQDTALFKGGTFYANTHQRHAGIVQLLGLTKNTLTISTAAGGITKSGGSGVITLTGSPDLTNIPTDGTAKVSITASTTPANNGEFPITAVDNGAKTITYTNAGAVTEAGTASSRAFPSKLTIAGTNYYGSLNGTETVGSQIYAIATAGSKQQNVADTCASLLRVVNQQTSPTVYGFYESGPDDGGGKMRFETTSFSGSQFTITAAGTLWYNSFNPTLPSGAGVTSSNDTAIHRLYYSKQDEPEHVPLVNYFDIGSRSKALLRIVPLREALLIFKEDGLYRLSGDGSGNWSVGELDKTSVLLRKQAVTVLGGKAYAACVNGILEITESGIRPISSAIFDKIRMFCDQHANPAATNLTAQAWYSDVDRTVGFYFTNEGVNNLAPTAGAVGLLWSQSTGSWTELPTSEMAVINYYGYATVTISGIPYRAIPSHNGLGNDLFTDDISYIRDPSITIAGANTNPIPVHRVLLPLTGHTATTITYTNTNLGDYGTIVVGSIISGATSQDTDGLYATVTNISTVGASTTLTLTPYGGSSSNLAATAGSYAYFWIAQSQTVEFVPFTAGDEGEYTRMTEVTVLLDPLSTLTTCTLNLYTEATSSTQVLSMTSTNTPLPSGILTQSAIRCPVPPNMQLCRRLSVVFQHSQIGEFATIRGISYEFAQLDGPAHELT